ncbi:hypothetical protein [Priestia megaterium]|uniref:hypothetical protein n=1 Tax=Priestia megaterium TaxID=1404 RepID=UPI0027880525|nr:hypothetical protein [Priestia megaterium]MDQ0805450.1 hypothetical protein [Priestia megaterium]
MKKTAENTDKVVRVIQCKNGGKVEVMNNDINVEIMARFFLGLPQIHTTEEKTEKETG